MTATQFANVSGIRDGLCVELHASQLVEALVDRAQFVAALEDAVQPPNLVAGSHPLVEPAAVAAPQVQPPAPLEDEMDVLFSG